MENYFGKVINYIQNHTYTSHNSKHNRRGFESNMQKWDFSQNDGIINVKSRNYFLFRFVSIRKKNTPKSKNDDTYYNVNT